MRLRSIFSVAVSIGLVFATVGVAAAGKTQSPSNSEVNDKFGYIDKRGQWAIKPQFDSASSFDSHGLAVVSRGGRSFFISKKGVPVVVPKVSSSISELRQFSEGLAVVSLANGKSGYIDSTGNFKIEPTYDYAASFKGGLARVTRKGLSGFIDKSGKLVVPLKYTEAEDFSEGLALVRQGKYGYVRQDGTVAIDFQFSSSLAASFSEGLAAVCTLRSKSYYIDKTGKTVIEAKFDDAREFHNGVAWVCTDKLFKTAVVDGKSVQWRICGNNWGLIDRRGRYLLQPQFDDIGDWSEGMATVKTMKWIEDEDGSPVIEWDSERWGFVDQTGRIVVSPRYLNAGRFSEGLAAVAVKDGENIRVGFIDKSGRTVIKPRFDCIDFSSLGLYFEVFSEGLCTVRQGEKIGYIDKSGTFVIKPQFGTAEPFSQGLASVSYTNHWEDTDGIGCEH